jgi:Heterokaryon incompatibility protein (HET)
MHKVYSRAYLTISADSSDSSSQGFLHPRSARHGSAVPLPWITSTSKTVNPYMSPRFREFPIEMKNSPLGQRGWTFQERALSPRILHFGSELTYWECKQACIGENMELDTYNVQDDFRHCLEAFPLRHVHGARKKSNGNGPLSSVYIVNVVSQCFRTNCWHWRVWREHLMRGRC